MTWPGTWCRAGSVFAFLAEHRRELFPDEFTADLFPSRTGRPSLPADLVGSVLVLKELYDLSDSQTADALKYDLRWKIACGRSLTGDELRPVHAGVLAQADRESARPDRVFDAVAEVIAETGILRGRRKRCVDSTVFDDAVATQDTVTQLTAAMRKVARVVPGAAAVIAAVCSAGLLAAGQAGRSTGTTRRPRSGWSATWSTTRWRCWTRWPGRARPERDDAAADALGLLALVAGQDVEPAEGSDGTDGRWRIARKVAPDRVISTVDREARHTRKSKSKRRDGFRGHVAAEPETGLVTDCEMTMAAGEGSTDAENGVKMAGRDRFADDDRAGPAAGGTGPESAADRGGDGPQAGGLEVYGDSAYGTGDARAAYRDAGIGTVIKPGPLRPAVPGGFTIDDFTVDEDDGTVTCPAGVTRTMSPRRDRDLRRRLRRLPPPGPVHHRQRRPVHDHPPARGPAARRPRPGPHRRVPAGLPHPVGDRAGHRLDRHPQRTPHQAPLHRNRQERRLAAHPVRRDQPAHPAPPRPDPPRRSLDPGLTRRHPGQTRREEPALLPGPAAGPGEAISRPRR